MTLIPQHALSLTPVMRNKVEKSEIDNKEIASLSQAQGVDGSTQLEGVVLLAVMLLEP